MRLVLVLSVLGVVRALWGSAPQDDAPVSVRVRHPWYKDVDGGAAYVLEMLEAAADIWPNDMAALVSRAYAPDALTRLSLKEATHNELYSAMEGVVYEHARARDSQQRLDEWRAAVAWHADAPKVEAAYQMYKTSNALRALEPKCASFIHWGGSAWCDAKKAMAAIEADLQKGVQTDAPREQDHVYAPRAAGTEATASVVLYADPFDTALREKHAALVDFANDAQARVQYVLRWRPTPPSSSDTASYLSGFGASLHLKKVDYLVIDDRKVEAVPDTKADAAVREAREHAREAYHKLEQKLYGRAKRPKSVQDAVAQQSALDADQIGLLGIGAAHAVLTSTNPLATLAELLYHFPAHAAGLAHYAEKTSSSNAVYTAIDDLQAQTVDGGASIAWINGKTMPIDQFHPIELLEKIRAERRLLDSFAAPEIGVGPAGAVQILTNAAVNAAFAPSARRPPRYDASDRIERAHADVSVIQWRNDLEEAMRGPKDLASLLRPRWPGQPLTIARNFFNLVLVPNVTDADSLRLLSEITASGIEAYGLRFGIVPLVDTSERSHAFAAVILYAMDHLTNLELAPFLASLAGAKDPKAARKALGKVLPAGAQKALQRFLKDGTLDDAMHARLTQTLAYLHRLRVPRDAHGAAYLNGQPLSFSDNVLHEALSTQVGLTRLAAQDIHENAIDEAQIATYFYDLPDTQRAPSAVLATLDGGEATYVDLAAAFQSIRESSVGGEANILRDLVYHDTHPANVTIRIVGDLDSTTGRALVAHALAAAETTAVRVGFVHAGGSGELSQFLYAAQTKGLLGTLPPAELRGALEHETLASLATKHDLTLSPSSASEFWQVASEPFVRVLGTASPALLVNGMVVRLENMDELDAAEIIAASEWEEVRHVEPLLSTLDVSDETRDMQSQAIEFVLAGLGTAFAVNHAEEGIYKAIRPTRYAVAAALQYSPAAFTAGVNEASIHVTLILDPMAAHAPSATAAIEMLAAMDDVKVTVVLNPKFRQPTLPLQQFTHFDARLRPVFEESGKERAPSVDFALLPPQAVLTMQLLAPRTLVTMADEAVYDLDNIRLADLAPAAREAGVEAVYSVQSLLVEGHARTEHSGIPHGLQLVLETEDGSQALDTIVMESMGYFQFRAQPGQWNLRIRQGRSADLYEIKSIGALGWQSPAVEQTGPALRLDALLGKTIYPVFEKRPGKEDVDLVAEMDAPAQSASSLARSRRGGHADINIFTLASGHLYERMTYIMVLSVLEHTKSSVKFWFVENFLSPSFKAFIPHLAEAYGFQYELITYAWPKWLREQTEKQRMIWAYKILFLDVLFPLDLDRVIFVDADQIVRADLQELVDMDLEGGTCLYSHSAVRLSPNGRRQRGHGRLPLLEAGLLAQLFARAHVPHFRAVRRGSAALPLRRRRRSASSAVPKTDGGQELAREPRPGPAQSLYVRMLTQCNSSCRSTRSTRPGCGARRGARTTGCPRPRPSICAATPRPRSQSSTARGGRSPSGISSTRRSLRSPRPWPRNTPGLFRQRPCRATRLRRPATLLLARRAKCPSRTMNFNRRLSIVNHQPRTA